MQLGAAMLYALVGASDITVVAGAVRILDAAVTDGAVVGVLAVLKGMMPWTRYCRGR